MFLAGVALFILATAKPWSYWKNVGGFLIACTIVAMALMGKSNAQTLGLHVGTVHEKAGFNDSNPGAYIVFNNGLTAGTYFNSISRQSNYIGYTVKDSTDTFAVTLTAITGYRPDPQYAAIPSVRIPLTQSLSGRITVLYAPDCGVAVHYSLEYKL